MSVRDRFESAGAASDLSPAQSAALPGGRDTVAQWLVFSLDASRYALPLSATERVVRAAQVTSLPAAPAIVLGAINIAGDVLPVFNLRRRFGLPERALDPADHFLIARTSGRRVVLIIDTALGVIQRPDTDMIAAERIAPALAHIRGVLPLAENLVLIHDLEQLLTLDESHALDEAMHARAPRAS
jgi:purine-binding chemotaxis protein CheW